MAARWAHRGTCRRWPGSVGLARKVGADLLPGLPAVARLPQSVRGEVQGVFVNGREHDWRGAEYAKVGRAQRLGNDVPGLAGTAVVARQLATIDDVGIERVRRGVSVFLAPTGCHSRKVISPSLPRLATQADPLS